VPRLDGVTPFLTQQDLELAQARYETARRNDPTGLVLPLFGTVLPDPGPDGDLEDRLMRALDQACPLQHVSLSVHNTGGVLRLDAEATQDGVLSLAALHAALKPLDPQVLPSVLSLLEWATARVVPVLGPKGVSEGVAAYWYSLEGLRDLHLPERFPEDQLHRVWRLSDREVVRLARRLGLPHAWQVTDGTPHHYFRDVPDMAGTLTRVQEVSAHLPGLAPLAELLEALVAHARGLPEMTPEEESEIPGLPMPHTVITVSPLPYCVVRETVDEYVQHHWEGGEDHPQVRLDIGMGAEDHRRLSSYLKHAPGVEQLSARVITLLSEVEDSLPCPQAPRRGRRG
jgi:hypothetical protein